MGSLSAPRSSWTYPELCHQHGQELDEWRRTWSLLPGEKRCGRRVPSWLPKSLSFSKPSHTLPRSLGDVGVIHL